MPRRAAAFLLVSLLCVAWAAPAAAAERILGYDVHALVAADGGVTLTERITVRAEGQQIRRGIIRDIPLAWRAEGKEYRLEIQVDSVSRNGRAEPFSLERDGTLLSLRIGSPTVTLTPGAHDYAITYRVKGAITREADASGQWDEFYWNVTGTDWQWPIERAAFSLELPDAARHADAAGRDARLLEINAYTGRSREAGGAARVAANGGVSATALRAGEGLTVSYAWPAGLTGGIARPRTVLTALAEALLPSPASCYLPLIPLLSIALFFLLWRRHGTDPAMSVIIPRFEPPNGLTPGAARAVRLTRWDDTCLVADIINLAAKGHLLIEQGKSEDDYSLHRQTPPSNAPALSPDERALLDNLLPRPDSAVSLSAGNRGALAAGRTLSSIRYATATRLAYRTNIDQWLIGLLPQALLPIALYFLVGPAVINICLVLYGLAFFLGGFLWRAFRLRARSRALTDKVLSPQLLLLMALLLALCLLFALLFAPEGLMPAGWAGAAWLGMAAALLFLVLMPCRTEAGMAQLAEIEGLALYMGVAEQHRLAALYPPEDSITRFERLLPFALALDTADTWANRFDDYLQKCKQPPPRSIGFAGASPGWSRHFTRRATSFGRAYTTAAAPARAASGFSGFSGGGRSSGRGGGGFSGGGRGGGGGRGW